MSFSIAVASLALLSPRQVPTFTSLQYVRVRAVNGASSNVVAVGPDAADNTGEELTIETATVLRRLVQEDEWSTRPGTYIGHPVAFAASSGSRMGMCSYGVVTGYTHNEHVTSLNIATESSTLALEFSDSTPLIKADRLNHALQTGANVNSTTMNAAELLELQTRCARSE